MWSAAAGDDRCNPRAAVRREGNADVPDRILNFKTSHSLSYCLSADPGLEQHKQLMKRLAAEAVAVQQYVCREKESILDAAQLLELAPVMAILTCSYCTGRSGRLKSTHCAGAPARQHRIPAPVAVGQWHGTAKAGGAPAAAHLGAARPTAA